MELIDFFCGGGGSSRGFHQVGFNTIAAFDKERYCVNTYNYNFGKCAYRRNIQELNHPKIMKLTNGQKPTIVTASPPCEPFTLANSNRVRNPFERLFDDKIGRLTIDTINLIGDLAPEFFVIENVTGILDGEGRDLIRDQINTIGYSTYFHILNAENFGVPSQRVRVVISNFKIEIPSQMSKTVDQAINDLPEPNYPHEFSDHVTLPISESYERKLPFVNHGESLIMFKGARNDMKNYIRIYGNKVAPVVMGKSRFIHPFYDRILTPREHARLMGFPDDHLFVGGWERIYDMIGEAVPPPITYEIGKQIVKML